MREQVHLQLVRHAPTAWNLEGKMQGNVDIPIDEKHTGEYFKKISAHAILQPEIIITSSLVRAKQTAGSMQKLNSWGTLPIFTHAELNERKWGILEGKTREEVFRILSGKPHLVERYPELLKKEEFTAVLDRDEFSIDEGESIQQVRDRVQKLLRKIPTLYPYKKILIVTHAGVLISLGLDFHAVSNLTLINRNGAWDIENG